MLMPNSDDAKQNINKSLLQGNFLSTIEENTQEEYLDVHEDVTLRSEEKLKW